MCESSVDQSGGRACAEAEFQPAETLRLRLDAQDHDISYFYASPLPGEPAGGLEDRHIRPVAPWQVRLSVRSGF